MQRKKTYKLGQIAKGRVVAVNQEENSVESLNVMLNDGQIAIVPAEEVNDNVSEEQFGVRRTARRYMGRTIIGKVIEENPIIISHRQAVEEKAKEITLVPGQVIEGIATWITKRQAEIEYNYCVRMTLPANEFGWLKGNDLRALIKPGQKLQVEIKDISEDGIIIVTHKKFEKNPWPEIQKKYHPRGQYLGQVTKKIDSGIFVNLEPGLDVLASPYPFFEVEVGDEVALEITDINPEAGKMKGYITARAMMIAEGR